MVVAVVVFIVTVGCCSCGTDYCYGGWLLLFRLQLWLV